MQKSKCDAILLLSGGIDSTTVLEQLTKQGKKVFCLIFDYKQSLRKEIAPFQDKREPQFRAD